MNWPFRFSFAATNDYGILWNPWGSATGGTDKNNLIFTNLTDIEIVGMIPPPGTVYVMGLTADTDEIGGAEFSLGYYDTTAAAFVRMYEVLTTAVAGGGIAYTWPDAGLRLPASSTRIPCIRHDGAAAAELTGSLHLYVPPLNVDDGSLIQPIQDEDLAYLLDESSQILFQG